MLKIMILVSAINSGDMDNANITVKALENNIGAQNVETSFIDISKDNDFVESKLSKVNNHEPKLVIAIGDLGVKALSNPKVKIDLDYNYVYWSGHQFTKGLEFLKVNHIAIPQTSITKEELNKLKSQNVEVTTTFAVPVKNPTKVELKNNYDSWIVSQKPSLNDDYIIVMVPGDAPDVDGKMKYFTPSSVKKLASDIESLWKSTGKTKKIVIQNGPRTGKYDHLTGEIACNHERMKGKEAQVDKSSKQLIKFFDDQKIPYRFFNFTFLADGESKKPESVFNELLYLAFATKDSIFIMPGESVSMAGQLPQFINPKNIIVFKPSSMNSGHKRIIDAGFKLGYFSIFEDDGSVLYPENPQMIIEDDASIIAKNLINGFNKKFVNSK